MKQYKFQRESNVIHGHTKVMKDSLLLGLVTINFILIVNIS